MALTIPGYLLAGIHYPKVQDLNVFYLYIGKLLILLAILVNIMQQHIGTILQGFNMPVR